MVSFLKTKENAELQKVSQFNSVLASLEQHPILTEAFRNVSFQTDYVISI